MEEPKVTIQDAPATAKAVIPAPETPTQRVIREANAVVKVRDSRGREITIRRIGMSVRRRVFKLFKEAGDRYLSLCMVAAAVVEIDGDHVDPFANGGSEVRFDHLLDRLDDHGFTAVTKGLNEHFPEEDSEAELKK